MPIVALIAGIISNISSIINEKIKDKRVAKELESEIQKQVIMYFLTHENVIGNIILAEIQGKWYQRLWRPLLMYIIIFILFNNYVLVPYLKAFGVKNITILSFPAEFWAILLVSIGGYIPLRSWEKRTISEKIEQIMKTRQLMISSSQSILNTELQKNMPLDMVKENIINKKIKNQANQNLNNDNFIEEDIIGG